jgi:hypothetical protein
MALAVSISDRKGAQPARPFADHGHKVHGHIGLLEGLRATEFLDVLGALRNDGVDHVIDRDDAQHFTAVCHDRHGQQIVFSEQARHLLAIGPRGNGNGCLGLRRLEHFAVRFTHDQAPQPDHLQQALGGRLQHADRIDGLAIPADVVDMLQRTRDRPVGRHGHKFGRHQTACRLRRVLQQLIEGLAHGPGQVSLQALTAHIAQLSKNLRPTIRLQAVQDSCGPIYGDQLEQLRRGAEIAHIEDLNGRGNRHGLKHVHGFGLLEPIELLGDVNGLVGR